MPFQRPGSNSGYPGLHPFLSNNILPAPSQTEWYRIHVQTELLVVFLSRALMATILSLKSYTASTSLLHFLTVPLLWTMTIKSPEDHYLDLIPQVCFLRSRQITSYHSAWCCACSEKGASKQTGFFGCQAWQTQHNWHTSKHVLNPASIALSPSWGPRLAVLGSTQMMQKCILQMLYKIHLYHLTGSPDAKEDGVSCIFTGCGGKMKFWQGIGKRISCSWRTSLKATSSKATVACSKSWWLHPSSGAKGKYVS